jgi:hypothetical protein
MKRYVNKPYTALVVAVVMVLSLFVNPVVVSGEPAAMLGEEEVFDISTAQPLQGTNWYFVEDVTYFNHNTPAGYVTVPTLFVNDGARLTITGNSGVEQNRRVVVNGTAHITLDNASIVRTGDAIRISEGTNPATYVSVSPMMLEAGANLTLTLVGDNTLAMATGANNRWSAGLGVPHGASIIIEGDGSLTAEGGLNAAGIGGHEGTHVRPRVSGAITINSGTINAIGRGQAAGIGGGSLLQTGRITVNGGNITATGGISGNFGGAGIGSGGSTGEATNDNVITINAGTITAIGGPASAGIGGASNAGNGAGTININGGIVTATGGSSAVWGSAGIGGGFGGHGGTINISGGIITATGGSNTAGTSGGGAGIGGGARGHSGNITITGGIIYAAGGPSAQNIGASISSGVPIAGGHVTIGAGAYITETTPPVTGLVWIDDNGQPQDAFVTHGGITQNLYINVHTSISRTPSFRWYTNATGNNLDGSLVAMGSPTFTLPPGLAVGTHYFFVEVSFTGVQGAYIRSRVARVEVQTCTEMAFSRCRHQNI